MAVHIDIIEGGSGRKTYDKNGQVGWEFNLVATVSGLELDSADDDALVAAVNELIAVTGDVGDGTYPGMDDPVSPCKLMEFQPELVSTTVVKVKIVYKQYLVAPAQIEVGSTISQVETNKDSSGALIDLLYTYPAGYEPLPLGADPTTRIMHQGGMYTRLTPETTVTFRLRMTMSPLAWAVPSPNYTGHVNATAILGLGARQWMCTDITGTSDDGGILWDVSVTFQARVDGWDQLCVFIDPATGKPPKDVLPNIGMKNIAPPTAEFHNMPIW